MREYGRIRVTENPYSLIFYAVKIIQTSLMLLLLCLPISEMHQEVLVNQDPT